MYAKSIKTRRNIIVKSAELFNKKGFAGTSLNDITEATGLSKGAIYSKFTDKEDIALAVLDYNTSKVLDGFKELIEKETTVVNKINAFGAYYQLNYKELIQNGGCPVMNAITEFDDQKGPICDRVKEKLGMWVGLMQDIIEEGKKDNSVKEEVNAGKYATLFVSMIEGGLLFAHFYTDPSHLLSSFEHINKILVAEVLTSAPQN